MNQTTKGQYGLGRITFKAHFAEIQQEIEAGYPLTQVYEKRKDKLGIAYTQFTRYVSKYITGVTVNKPKGENSVQNEQGLTTEATPNKYIPQTVTPKKGLNDPTPLADSELF